MFENGILPHTQSGRRNVVCFGQFLALPITLRYMYVTLHVPSVRTGKISSCRAIDTNELNEKNVLIKFDFHR